MNFGSANPVFPIQWQIQDLPEGVPTPEVCGDTYYFTNFFAENCIKMKEIGLRRESRHRRPPWIRHCNIFEKAREIKNNLYRWL